MTVNVLSQEKQLQLASMLCESMSVRSIERLTRVHRDTVCRYLLRFGAQCQKVLDQYLTGVCFNSLEVDELWGFVYCKQRSVQLDDPESWGDAYCFVAQCADTKVVPHFELGKRDQDTTWRFCAELARRVVGRVQVNTDGFQPYTFAVPTCFGQRADYMQIIKNYAGLVDRERTYSPAEFVGIDRKSIQGCPKFKYAGTSHIEAQNAGLRTHVRRLGRLTRCFSKKWENLRAALQVHFASHNFCKIHRSLKTTPMVAAGLIDQPWSVEELLEAA